MDPTLLVMHLRTLAEHAGIRAGVLFYDWVTALISCLVIGSVLISRPCREQLSLSPRLMWSCGLSCWVIFSVTQWEHWGPYFNMMRVGCSAQWVPSSVCQSSHKASGSAVCLKEVAEIWQIWNKCLFHGKFTCFFVFPHFFTSVTQFMKASNVIRYHLQTSLHVLIQFQHRNQSKWLISVKKRHWQSGEKQQILHRSTKFRGKKAFWLSICSVLQ